MNEKLTYELQKESIELQKANLELQKENAKTMQNLFDKGVPLISDYMNKKLQKVETPKVRWPIIGFVIILTIIVVGSGLLVYLGKLDSDNFTLLLGTLIGASISLLRDIIVPSE